MVGNIPGYLGLFVMYANATRPDATFDSEILELSGFILRLEIACASVGDEYFKAKPELKDNAKTVAGLEQMRKGYGETAGGVIQFLSDASVRPAEAVRFVGELKGLLPKLSPEMTPEAGSDRCATEEGDRCSTGQGLEGRTDGSAGERGETLSAER